MNEQDNPFILVHCISSKPGNQTLRSRIRTKTIMSFAEADTQYIQIGAASVIDISNGTMLVVKETVDEIDELIALAEKVKT